MTMWYINTRETLAQKQKRQRESAIRKANFEKKIGYIKREEKRDDEER